MLGPVDTLRCRHASTQLGRRRCTRLQTRLQIFLLGTRHICAFASPNGGTFQVGNHGIQWPSIRIGERGGPVSSNPLSLGQTSSMGSVGAFGRWCIGRLGTGRTHSSLLRYTSPEGKTSMLLTQSSRNTPPDICRCSSSRSEKEEDRQTPSWSKG